MASAAERLPKAFHEDHAILGRGFHRISTALRAGNLDAACSTAALVDRDAGAHIAFEEKHFYPALLPLLGKEHVERMLEEHELGLGVVRALEALNGEATLPEDRRRALLRASEAMEVHIAECGELFEAMGRIPEEEQASLLEALLRLRAEQPAWTAVSDSLS